MRLFIIVGVALLASGCAPSHQQILETAQAQTFAAFSACQARAGNGEFHTEADRAACEGDGMIQAHLAAGDPDTDLYRVLAARNLAVAQAMDAGRMTSAQAQDYLRSVIDQIKGAIAQREAQREAAQAQAAADALAVMGAALSNYGAAVQSAPPPVVRPPTFVHCFTTGAVTNCY